MQSAKFTIYGLNYFVFELLISFRSHLLFLILMIKFWNLILGDLKIE